MQEVPKAGVTCTCMISVVLEMRKSMEKANVMCTCMMSVVLEMRNSIASMACNRHQVSE